MLIGNADKGSERIRFSLDLRCTRCQKRVPGGMAAAERYFGTHSFFLEVDRLKKAYLCGACRDLRRAGR